VPVTQDVVSSASLYTSNSAAIPFPLNTSAFTITSSGLLIVKVQAGLSTGVGFQVTITGVTWDGVAMTELIASRCGANLESQAKIYYLLNPALGNKVLSISGTETGTSTQHDVAVGFECFSGHDTTTPLSGAAASTTESATSLSAATTEAVSASEMATVLAANGSGTLTSLTPAGSDDYSAQNSGSTQLGTHHGGSVAGSGAAVTFQENWSGADHGIILVARIRAAGAVAGADRQPRPMLMKLLRSRRASRAPIPRLLVPRRWYGADTISTTPVSQSNDAVIEALQGIAASLADPLDEAAGVGPTGTADPVEAAQGIVTTVSDPIEESQGIAATAADPLDAAAGVAATLADPLEAIQAIPGTATSDPVDAAQGLVTTGTDPVDAAAGLATSATDPLEAAQGVAATGGADPLDASGNTPVSQALTVPIEAAGAIAQTSAGQLDETGAVASSSGDPVEAAGAVTPATRTDPLEATQGIGPAGAADPVEASRGVASSSAVPVEALAAVVAASGVPVEAAQAISAAATVLPYETLLAVAATKALPLEALAAVAAAISADPIESTSLALPAVKFLSMVFATLANIGATATTAMNIRVDTASNVGIAIEAVATDVDVDAATRAGITIDAAIP
jgi:hypothetical protein